MLLPPELKVPRARSAHTEIATNLASLSYYDLRELRAEEPEINAACIPFMEEAVRAYGPAGVDGAPAPLLATQRYPGDIAFVHQRLEAMDAKLDGLRADIKGLAGDSPGDVAWAEQQLLEVGF